LSEARRIEVTNELLAAMGMSSLRVGGATFSQANPILEQAVGRIVPPRFTSRELYEAIAACLARADRPLSAKDIAHHVVRAKGGISADDRLARRINTLLCAMPNLGKWTGTGWLSSKRELPAPQTTGQTYTGTVNADGAKAVRDHLLLNPRRSAAAVAAWQRPRRPNRSEGPPL
jgi:hypothetical protein